MNIQRWHRGWGTMWVRLRTIPWSRAQCRDKAFLWVLLIWVLTFCSSHLLCNWSFSLVEACSISLDEAKDLIWKQYTALTLSQLHPKFSAPIPTLILTYNLSHFVVLYHERFAQAQSFIKSTLKVAGFIEIPHLVSQWDFQCHRSFYSGHFLFLKLLSMKVKICFNSESWVHPKQKHV